ncbi:MAG: hypothetical protein ACE10D_11835, partial [Planctomycetota bacterium]
VTFQRGGREVRLHKSPHLIAVRFRSGAVPQNLTGPEGRELDRLRGRASLRFVRRAGPPRGALSLPQRPGPQRRHGRVA